MGTIQICKCSPECRLCKKAEKKNYMRNKKAKVENLKYGTKIAEIKMGFQCELDVVLANKKAVKIALAHKEAKVAALEANLEAAKAKFYKKHDNYASGNSNKTNK